MQLNPGLQFHQWVADEYTIIRIPNLKAGESSFLTNNSKKVQQKLKQGKWREPKEGKGEAC